MPIWHLPRDSRDPQPSSLSLYQQGHEPVADRRGRLVGASGGAVYVVRHRKEPEKSLQAEQGLVIAVRADDSLGGT